MNTRLAGLALASLLLLTSPAYADDPEPKKAEETGKLISLQFDEAPIAQVIQAIAVAAGKNIIISPDVKGRVSIHLKQVPWLDALRLVTNSLGFKAVVEKHGIVMVLASTPKPGRGPPLPPMPATTTKAKAAPKADVKAKALGVTRRVSRPGESGWIRAWGAKKGKAASTQAELEHARVRASLARSEKRIAELSAALDRAKTDGGDVATLHAAALKAYAEKAKRKQPQVLQVIDIADLDPKDKRLLAAIAAVKKQGGIARRQGSALVVRSTAAVGKSLGKALERIRTGHVVVVDSKGRTMKVEVVRGEVLLDTIRKAEVRELELSAPLRKSGRVVDSKGRPLGGVLISGEARPAPHNTAKVRAAEARIENLLRALKHLKAANAKAEALRVTKQVSVARSELASLKAEMDAQRQKAAAARAELQRYRVRIGRGASGEAGGRGARSSLHALHEEIRALRGDVRALTELVRELLASQKRRR